MSDDSEFDGIMAAIGESLASRPAIKATPSVVVGYVDGPICNHGACLVDAAKRKVECRRCGVALDPIDELQRVARRSDTRALYDERVRLEKEIRALNEAAPKLRAIHSRLRSKVKAARAELAALGVPSDVVKALMAAPVVTQEGGGP